MEEKRRHRHKKKKRTGLKVLLFSLLLLLVIGSGYGISVYRHLGQTTDKIYKPVEEGEVELKRSTAINLINKEPISILLLGIDSGDKGRIEQGRSDSLLIATVNPSQRRTTLMSIPRDSYTEIVGHGTWDKINHAYAFGGTEMAMNTVQNLLDIPIDYYVTVNMSGIKEIVDAVDGIDVASPLTFTFDGYQFYENELAHMDGEAALAFARMRYDDLEGDTGRQGRQRLVIEGVIDKVTSLSTFFNYQKILGSLSNNIQTNFQTADYSQLQSNDYLSAARNIVSEQIGGEGTTLDDGIWYHFIDEDELERVQTLLRNELELDEP